ncbi:MAG: glycosyltransferase [Alphaproteobacteria bacterium]
MKWLFYAANGNGVGHVIRTVALARQVRKRAPESEFLFLTESEASHLIWREGFASIKLLSMTAIREKQIDPGTVYALNRSLTANVYAAFRPEVMVVDCFPGGTTKFMYSVMPNTSLRIFLYREKKNEKRDDPAFAHELSLFHQVLVVHEPGETALPQCPGVGVTEVGNFLIRSRQEALPRDEARRILGLPAEGMVVFVGFGGGGDPRYDGLLRMALKAAERFPRWTFACAAPPLYRGQMPARAAANVVAIGYFPLAEVMTAFDGAICRLGTNTYTEMSHFGIPAIYLPRMDTFEDDHEARGRRVTSAAAGWVVDESDEAGFERALDALADDATRAKASANAQALVRRNGAEAVAASLVEWAEKMVGAASEGP